MTGHIQWKGRLGRDLVQVKDFILNRIVFLLIFLFGVWISILNRSLLGLASRHKA